MKRWTNWRLAIAGVAATLAVVLSPLFFADMFMTVRDMLAPDFGAWPWIVPIATEGAFVIFYLFDLLLTLFGKPMGWLRWMPYLFAAGSLALNAIAGHGDPAATIGHAMTTLAFFGPVIAGEAVVRKLAVSDEEIRKARALADARRYAIDYCRAAKGAAWRWRVPSLVRVQILRNRLPDEVRQAVEMRASMGGWQKDVREWLSGPDALNLQRQAQSDTRSASEAIAQSAPQAASEPVTQVVPQAAPPAASRTSPGAVRKPAPSAVKRMTPGDLAPYVGTLLETAPGTTPSDLMKSLRIGREKATEALRLAKRERLQAVAK